MSQVIISHRQQLNYLVIKNLIDDTFITQVLNSSSTTTSSRVAKTTSSQRLHHITASSSTSSQSSQSQLSSTSSGSVVNPGAIQRDLHEFKNSMSEINNLAARSNQMAELQKR